MTITIPQHTGQPIEATGTLADILLALATDPQVREHLERYQCSELRLHYSPAEVEVYATRKLGRRKRER